MSAAAVMQAPAAPVQSVVGGSPVLMSSVTMPAAASPVMTYTAAATQLPAYSAAPVTSMVATPIPRYHYPAGSTEVPVYGSSITAPALYQQPTMAMPTVTYQTQEAMSQEQMKTIFPMGAPNTFTPFTAPQYQYNIVDSTNAFMPAPESAAVAPAPETEAPKPESTPASPSSTKGSSKKDKASKKLSSKKKNKSCC